MKSRKPWRTLRCRSPGKILFAFHCHNFPLLMSLAHASLVLLQPGHQRAESPCPALCPEMPSSRLLLGASPSPAARAGGAAARRPGLAAACRWCCSAGNEPRLPRNPPGTHPPVSAAAPRAPPVQHLCAAPPDQAWGAGTGQPSHSGSPGQEGWMGLGS